jgi:diketogulonate reductase-like aldo/keto reductase
MKYAKVVNGQVVQIGLPTNDVLTTGENAGSLVANYHMLDEDTLKLEGWLPLTNNQPVYDNATQYLEHAGYTVGVTEVVVNYLVKQIAPVTAIPTTEERLRAVEEALLMII